MCRTTVVTVATSETRYSPTAPVVTQNHALHSLVCLRCEARHPVADLPQGCPACLANGTPANVVCAYQPPNGSDPAASGVRLPYSIPFTLGEGGTPLLRPGADIAGDLDLWLKWEGANPTGSHKDRFSAAVVARALYAGYETVAAASSGNAGVSLAAYCGRAGLGCEISVTEDTPGHVVGLMRDLGADVLVFSTAGARWRHLAGHLESPVVLPVTDFRLPPVGSSAFGIEGYKTLAAEILAGLAGRWPDWVVLPTSRGDLAWGVHLGFSELCGDRPVPRLCLVEPFPGCRPSSTAPIRTATSRARPRSCRPSGATPWRSRRWRPYAVPRGGPRSWTTTWWPPRPAACGAPACRWNRAARRPWWRWPTHAPPGRSPPGPWSWR